MTELCPTWCRADHDETHDGDQRHETATRTVPVISRGLHDGSALAEADELHVAAFRFFAEDEMWITVDGLQITPESARRLIRELDRVVERVAP